MDHYSREALKMLGESLEASGEIVQSVADWTNPDAAHAQKCHITGALENAHRVSAAAIAVGVL